MAGNFAGVSVYSPAVNALGKAAFAALEAAA